MMAWKAPTPDPDERTVAYWHRMIDSLEEHVNRVLAEVQPRSQVRDHRDQWERGPARGLRTGREREFLEHARTVEGLWLSGRVEAGSGEERCETLSNVTADGTIADVRIGRCIFRRSHQGRCAFSVEGR